MTLRRLKLLFLFVISSESAWAGSVSVVAFVQGEVTVNGKQAAQGLLLQEGDTIEVGEGRATLILDRDRVVHLSSRGKIRLDDLKEGSQAEIKLDYGAMRSLVKSSPSRMRSFRVKTPSAVMGVRGTQFFAELPRSGELTGEGLRVATLEGQVAVWDGRAPSDAPPRPALLSAGQALQVSAANTAVAVGGKSVSQVPVTQLKEAEVREVRAATQAASRPIPGMRGPMTHLNPPSLPGLNGGTGFQNPGFMQGFNPPMKIDLRIE